MKFNYVNALIISLFTGLVGCKTNLNIPRPQETYQTTSIPAKSSTLAFSIDLDLKQLSTTMNRHLTGLIYDDNRLDDDKFMMKIWKQQDIKFTIDGNVIHCTVPLKIWAKTGFKNNLLGIIVEDYYEASGALTAKISTQFKLDKNWKLITTSKIESYQWTEKPSVNIAGYSLPVTSIADLAMKASTNVIGKQIDQAIAENIDVKKILTQTWNLMQSPILVNQEHAVWFKMTPSQILTSSIEGKGDKMQIQVWLSSLLETSIGRKIEKTKLTQLPDYKIGINIRPEFNINTNVVIPYKKVEDLARIYVIGKEFKAKDKKVIIEAVKIYGQGNQLVVQATVKGSANGIIYCIGKPVYDEATKTLRITDFNFDMKTKNLLVKSANWLMHNSFLKMIEPMLNIPMGEQMDNALAGFNDQLKNYELMKGVVLKSKVSNLKFEKILMTPDSFVLNWIVSGQVALSVTDFEIN